MTKQFRVTVQMDDRHPKHPGYPLLPGDILVLTPKRDGGGYTKVAPGLGIFGFQLSDEDIATLEPADDARWYIA